MNSYDSVGNTDQRVREMLSKKFGGITGGIDEHDRSISHGSSPVDPENMTVNQRINESLSSKLTDYYAKKGVYTGKYAASKYLGRPISELMSEERKAQNLVRDARDNILTFRGELLQKYKNEAMKVGGYDEARAEGYAQNYFLRHIVGSYAKTDAEKELHEKYKELDAELLRVTADQNAIAVAKADYMDQNADLIKEVQEQKRREDLVKSGLLSELGLRAPEPKETETKTDNEEE